MKTLYLPLILLLLLGILSSCASSMSQEIILCDPPQAEIYWGKTESNLEKTGLKTPSSRSISGSNWESWCYQVKKNGYHDSEITCRGEEGFRYLDFRLIPLRTEITSEPTGAVIYWGPTKDRLERTDFRTPRIVTVEDLPTDRGSDWEEWYFQVKKEGYQDSEIIFSPALQQDRNIHFKLVPVTR